MRTLALSPGKSDVERPRKGFASVGDSNVLCNT
jgi:hypothetical protein